MKFIANCFNLVGTSLLIALFGSTGAACAKTPGKGYEDPPVFAAADIEKEVAEHLFAFGGMMNFGVKLKAVKLFFRMNRCRDLGIFCGSRDLKTGRQLYNGISMAHPALCFFVYTI